MAVSRRLRFEILTRDNHTCRYCGGKPPNVELTVDHVLPVALGGTDEPSNLVAACKDCNGGKAASTPGAPLVAQVAADAERWAAAIKEVARRRDERAKRDEQANQSWLKVWTKIHARRHGDICNLADCEWDLPSDWRDTLRELRTAGLTPEGMVGAFKQTVSRDFFVRSRWRYLCGTAWGMLRAQNDEAASLLADGWTPGEVQAG